MRISDWSSDVCSSDLLGRDLRPVAGGVLHQLDVLRYGYPGCALGLAAAADLHRHDRVVHAWYRLAAKPGADGARAPCDQIGRAHVLTPVLMRISYAVFSLKIKLITPVFIYRHIRTI